MIKAIIFDVDGTLLDTERIYMAAWVKAGELFGYKVTDEVLLKTRAASMDVAIPLFKEYCGEDFPYHIVREKREIIAEAIISYKGWGNLIKPGTVEVLKLLQEDGYKLAVASSTNYSLTKEHLEGAGLLTWFPVAVGGDMVEQTKPAPDIFLLAAARMGVQPEECVVVGDTPADVLAATAADMKAIFIPDCVPVNDQIKAFSWRIIDSIRQVPDALRSEDNILDN